MRVLVDSTVWSHALRHKTRTTEGERVSAELADLIREKRVAIIGAVRQEVLFGISSAPRFQQVRDTLGGFPDIQVTTLDHEHAALLFNRCRAGGIQGSHIDFLICAVALRRKFAIFSTDKDFIHFHKVMKLDLHRTRA